MNCCMYTEYRLDVNVKLLLLEITFRRKQFEATKIDRLNISEKAQVISEFRKIWKMNEYIEISLRFLHTDIFHSIPFAESPKRQTLPHAYRQMAFVCHRVMYPFSYTQVKIVLHMYCLRSKFTFLSNKICNLHNKTCARTYVTITYPERNVC